MSEQENSLRCDYVPGCGYKIWQDAKEFCYTTDAIFLGNFPHVVRKAKVLELRHRCNQYAAGKQRRRRGDGAGLQSAGNQIGTPKRCG